MQIVAALSIRADTKDVSTERQWLQQCSGRAGGTAVVRGRWWAEARVEGASVHTGAPAGWPALFLTRSALTIDIKK